jgi:hypothetical protein
MLEERIHPKSVLRSSPSRQNESDNVKLLKTLNELNACSSFQLPLFPSNHVCSTEKTIFLFNRALPYNTGDNMNKKALLLLLLLVILLVKPAFAVVGDVNGDGKVDIRDVAMVVAAFGSYPGSPKWNPACDLNGDLKIDIRDVAIVCAHFGQHD